MPWAELTVELNLPGNLRFGSITVAALLSIEPLTANFRRSYKHIVHAAIDGNAFARAGRGINYVDHAGICANPNQHAGSIFVMPMLFDVH